MPDATAWLKQTGSPLGEALATIARYRDGPGRFPTDGRVETDSNNVERPIRPIAPDHKNALCAGHDARARPTTRSRGMTPATAQSGQRLPSPQRLMGGQPPKPPGVFQPD